MVQDVDTVRLREEWDCGEKESGADAGARGDTHLGRHRVFRALPPVRLALSWWIAAASDAHHGVPGRADLRASGAGHDWPDLLAGLPAQPPCQLRMDRVRRAQQLGDAGVRDAD